MIYGHGKEQCQLKYVLAEEDIHVDMVKFNEACCNVFNMIFKNGLDDFKKNVIFMQH